MNICSNIKVFLLFIKEIYFEMILLTLFNRTKTVWQILIILPDNQNFYLGSGSEFKRHKSATLLNIGKSFDGFLVKSFNLKNNNFSEEELSSR